MESGTEKKKGERNIFFGAFLWAFFPIVTVLSYAVLPSLVSLAWSTVFAALFFGCVIFYRGKLSEIKNPLLWKYALFAALFCGVLYYSFFYVGLETTTPGNAAIIALFEVFTSYLFFHVIRKERFSNEHGLGAILMVAGAVIVLGQNFTNIRMGDFLVLAATFFSPVGNLFQQKARQIASSESIMFLRSLISAPIVFLLVYFFHQNATLGDIRSSLIFLLINGVLLLGFSKMLWIEAIHRISVTKSVALSSLTPFLTLLFAWLLLHQTPSLLQLSSLVPLVVGTLLLTDQWKFARA
jgi:drug/metabolite transporter (DMT)-like permease